MAKIRRNGPCPCGSGSKAKRCCYGNHWETAIHCLPLELLGWVVPELEGIDAVEVRSLLDELLYLPVLDPSLQLRLGILTPTMDAAIGAIQDDDVDVLDELIHKVVAEVDSPRRRAELIRAVTALRDEGRIPSELAAMAVLELTRKRSAFFLSSVVKSLAVLAGDRSTPTGLIVATG